MVPLLSIVTDVRLREELAETATGVQDSLVMERRLSAEAQVLETLSDLMKGQERSPILLRDVAANLSERHGSEFDRPITIRWVGVVIRRRLKIATYKTNGAFAVPPTERPKIEYLCRRYGVELEHGSRGSPAGGS
jgi:hypothetical protein